MLFDFFYEEATEPSPFERAICALSFCELEAAVRFSEPQIDLVRTDLSFEDQIAAFDAKRPKGHINTFVGDCFRDHPLSVQERVKDVPRFALSIIESSTEVGHKNEKWNDETPTYAETIQWAKEHAPQGAQGADRLSYLALQMSKRARGESPVDDCTSITVLPGDPVTYNSPHVAGAYFYGGRFYFDDNRPGNHLGLARLRFAVREEVPDA
jgi:hypothetical protein